jgi:hypothetical protein
MNEAKGIWDLPPGVKALNIIPLMKRFIHRPWGGARVDRRVGQQQLGSTNCTTWQHLS